MISEIAGSDRFRVNLSHSYNRNLCPICPTSEPPLSIKPLNKYMSEASTKRQSIKISVRDSLTQQVAAVQNQNSQSQSQVKEGSDG